MYEIIYKFFRNLEKVKAKKLNKDNLIVYLQRVVLIFINSLAFFENDKEKVANVNISITEEFNLENTLKASASLLNIKPMFEKEDTLTRALFFHPIISHILFPQDNSKLNNLPLIGQNNEKLKNKANEISDKELKNKIIGKFHKHYQKYFRDANIKKEINIDEFYEINCETYLNNILKEYIKLHGNEKQIAREVLTNQELKYDKVYRLIKDNIENHIHPWFTNEKPLKKYEKIIYNA